MTSGYTFHYLTSLKSTSLVHGYENNKLRLYVRIRQEELLEVQVDQKTDPL